MLVLRLTQSLLKDMKAAAIEDCESSLLFSWHANMYQLNNRKHIIFMNDLSRLSVIVDGVRSSQLEKMKEKFKTTLSEYLRNEGVSQSLIKQYFLEGSEVVISKTNSRSVLGTMKEVIWYTQDTHLEYADHIGRMKWLNKLIYKPIDYKEPRDVFKEALKTRYSHSK
ncbi:hypothetical protein G8C92_30985 [Paenibacillus donghaensis]|uniref:DUF6933 domain-containing protein n=1 Tax=Paenibacillus donghaensis TaxID=414771 RepID=UPI001884173F|nr:hypothetical protein [Paenibacillus donghaensis]MBE9918423.1 hypothetical protein [Paenibacillus donghaensis]